MASLIVSHMEQSGVRVMRHCEPAALEKVDNGKLVVTSNEKGHENSSKVFPYPLLFLLPSPSHSLFLSLSLPPPLSSSLSPYYWSSLSTGRMGYCVICYRYTYYGTLSNLHIGSSVCLLHVQCTCSTVYPS